eukprot:scaffold12257_cov84-Cylindrotheca_fusiformis.AAC.1
MGALQKKLMKAKDARIELNSEVLAGMKIIKLQAWEEPFSERITELRQTELSQLLWYYVVSALSVPIEHVADEYVPAPPTLCRRAVFFVPLTAVCLSVSSPFILSVINSIVEASLSLERICSFLLSQDYKPIKSNDLQENGVQMQMLSAAYDSQKPKASSDEERGTIDRDWEMALL